MRAPRDKVLICLVVGHWTIPVVSAVYGVLEALPSAPNLWLRGSEEDAREELGEITDQIEKERPTCTGIGYLFKRLTTRQSETKETICFCLFFFTLL